MLQPYMSGINGTGSESQGHVLPLKISSHPKTEKAASVHVCMFLSRTRAQLLAQQILWKWYLSQRNPNITKLVHFRAKHIPSKSHFGYHETWLIVFLFPTFVPLSILESGITMAEAASTTVTSTAFASNAVIGMISKLRRDEEPRC